MGYDPNQRKNYEYAPFFIDETNDISYTYSDQEGLKATSQSRGVLRARSVLAFAYMRANISFFQHEGLIFYGETQKLNGVDVGWMKDDAKEFVKIKGTRTAHHVGYYIVAVNPNAGWGGQAGWAVAFMKEETTPEHMMWYLYGTLRPSMVYLLKKPEIANNIMTSRAPYKNKITEFQQPSREFTNSGLP